MAKKLKWIVRLGETEWMRFTYPRLPGDAIRLLGSVHRGIQIGALAETADGKYVQVVGDLMVNLNRSQIAGALKRVDNKFNSQFFSRPVAASAPVVIVKRRRIPVMA